MHNKKILITVIKYEIVMLTQRDVIKCAVQNGHLCCPHPPHRSHITNVGPSLDLFATVGKPVVNFQGGDPLQIGQLLSWNTSHDKLVTQRIPHSPSHPNLCCCCNENDLFEWFFPQSVLIFLCNFAHIFSVTHLLTQAVNSTLIRAFTNDCFVTDGH